VSSTCSIESSHVHTFGLGLAKRLGVLKAASFENSKQHLLDMFRRYGEGGLATE